MTDNVSTEEIQSIARELQMVRSQIQSLSSQVSEFSITIDALGSQEPDRPVYRSLGNILRLIEREEALRKQYEKLAADFEGA